MRRGFSAATLAALSLCLLAPTPAPAAANYFETVFGTGAIAFADGVPGKRATLNNQYGVARLDDGSILIADYGNNRVRKLALDGSASTVVGTGTATSTGDGSAATAATVNGPIDVEVAPDGVSYYVSEYTGHRVRLVDASGEISTVVGTGTQCAAPTGGCGDFGPAASAQLRNPRGLGVAANGDLFIADGGNNKVRRVLASGGIASPTSTIVTVAGTGAAGATGDGGVALAATINGPYDVLPQPGGALLIADTSNNRVRRVDSAGVIRAYSSLGTCAGTTSLCGDGSDIAVAYMAFPSALADDGAGGVLIAESTRNRVRRVSPAGVTSTVVGSGASCGATDRCGDDGPAETASLVTPRGVVASADGQTIYVSDGTNRLRARKLYATNAGPTGPSGNSGAQGPAGSTGATGAGGSQGSTGDAGAAGVAGAQGATGASGATGPTGADGPAGGTGVSGQVGAKGVAGDRGPAAMMLPLTVALPSSRVIWPAGRRVRQRVYVSSGSTLTARVLADSHAVSQVRVFVRSGLKQLDFGRLPRGRYRIVVVIEDVFGQRSTDRITLVVR